MKLVWPARRQLAQQLLELLLLAALGQRPLELELAVEMVLDDALVAAGDEDEMLDAGGPASSTTCWITGPVDDRQHLLGHRLGGGQKAGAEPRHRKHGLADAPFGGLCMRKPRIAQLCRGVDIALNGMYASDAC